jgi:hypothetical protein
MGNFSTTYYATGANGEATVTLAAKAGSPAKPWTVNGFLFGFTATPDAGALLTISNGSDVVLRVPITTAGPGPVVFPPTSGSGNTAMTIAITGGGTGIGTHLTVFVV